MLSSTSGIHSRFITEQSIPIVGCHYTKEKNGVLFIYIIMFTYMDPCTVLNVVLKHLGDLGDLTRILTKDNRIAFS